MTFFTNLTTSVKQKWLEFFQNNRSWILRQMEFEYVATPDGGRRPSSHLILGVVSALEPQLAELLVPFTKLNPDINVLIDILELNFDPERFQGISNPIANPHTTTNNPNETMDAFMGMMDDEAPAELNELSMVEVVDKTQRGHSQQNHPEQSQTAQSELGDVWLEELNQETTHESDQKLDPAHNKEQKQSGDDEISRLFPNF